MNELLRYRCAMVPCSFAAAGWRCAAVCSDVVASLLVECEGFCEACVCACCACRYCDCPVALVRAHAWQVAAVRSAGTRMLSASLGFLLWRSAAAVVRHQPSAQSGESVKPPD